MIVLTAVLHAKAGKELELKKALAVMIPLVQPEEGARSYVLHQAINDPAKFFFYEKYVNQAAMDYHNSTPHIKELFSKFPELLANDPEVELYNDIAAIQR